MVEYSYESQTDKSFDSETRNGLYNDRSMTMTGPIIMTGPKHFTELEAAMIAHIKHLTFEENRSFMYLDFKSFEVNGKTYNMGHGTFRNKVSKLIKAGIVELYCRSNPNTYTLKGHKFSSSVTSNHMVVRTLDKNSAAYKMFKNLPFGKQSLHDIRLTFKAPNLWNTLEHDTDFNKNERSKDISFPIYQRRDKELYVLAKIHKTDVVSVIIGCSLHPIPLDIDGIMTLFTTLARAEEQLYAYLRYNCASSSICNIPDYKEWIVTMWHFGRDSLTEYSGEKYSIRIEDAKHILATIYTKDFKNKTKIRIETQEYPNKGIAHAIQEKINS